VEDGLAQPLPPRVDPLDHNGSCNSTRTGDDICDPISGATMLSPLVRVLMMIAFITFKSSLVPLFEGL